MARIRFDAWRGLFLAAGLLIMAGGPRHPQGTMAEMLAHQDWFMSHALMTAAFAAMLAGLLLFAREAASPGLRRWTRLAIAATVLQTIEMIVHTAASVDHANLVAGRSTPVLTTHINMTMVVYPIFGVVIAGFIINGMRERAVGSPWIAWLGIFGAIAWGAAGLLTVAFEISWAPRLFPMVTALAVWMMLAAVWPRRVIEAAPAMA